MTSDIIKLDPNDKKKTNIKNLVQGTRFLKDINFLNHIGYFCHDPKKAKSITEPPTYIENTTINKDRIEIVYKISPNAEFGYPSVTAFNICDFIDRVLSNYGRPAMNPIPFDMVTLREFLNLKKSGKNNKTIKNALRQLRATLITTSHFFLDRSKKFIESDYTIIEKLVFVGEKQGDDKDIKAGLIYLNEDIIKSFNNKNQMPVNYERYADLPPPTKVLYLKLFRAFSAARKVGKKNDEISVENDYNALCRVLGFTPQKHKSRIEQQLEPHLVQLQDIKNLVKSWSILKKKNKDGYKLKTSPGKGHDEDYEKFNKKKEPEQFELDFNKRDKETVAEIEAVRYFQEKMFGIKPDTKESHMGHKEVVFAKDLLKTFPGEKIYKFIDYAIQEAKQTEFPIKTLNGLSGFINAFKGIEIKTKKVREIVKAQKNSQSKEEEAKKLYCQFIDEIYNNYLDGLKPNEREKHQQVIHIKITRTIFCDGKNKQSPIYMGLYDNEVREFTENNLINEFDFKAFLKTNGKDYLLDIKIK